MTTREKSSSSLQPSGAQEPAILRALLKRVLDHIEDTPDCWSESGAWQSSERDRLVDDITAALAAGKP
jgi:hypothetical protein